MIKFSMALFCAFSFLIFNCSFEPELPERGICAHRGANNTHPENTLAAFKEAIRLGAHMIEFDVQMTRDSSLVIIHDDTLGRTTNGQGNVSDFTLAELKKLDAGFWKDPKFKGEKIPTLNETLSIMPKNIWLNIHLKDNNEFATVIGKAVAELIINKGLKNQAVIACKSVARKAVKKVDSTIKICNMERLENSKIYVEATILMNADFIQLKTRADTLLHELRQQLKGNNIRINYFGLRKGNPEETFGSIIIKPEDKLKRLFALGVEFPLVDEVDKMIIAANELGIKPVKHE